MSPDATTSSAVAAVPTELSDWWKTAVVYQIYPLSFADGNGDGIGDLAGIAAHLDYLAGLGVDVLWLSPIYPSPRDDNGYDISDYQGIDPIFGTLEEFDALLAKVHERGMKLVMDLVVNHTSDEHPWFLESRSSTDNPKRDWYWWRPAREGHRPGEPGAEPNNWGSAFSGSAWQLDEKTGEYYLHLFSRKQPDLNWENPEVRHAIYQMMRWWLDRGIDGFRMDVVNFLSKNTKLPDGAMSGDRKYGFGDFVNGPRIHEFVHEMYQEVFAGRSRHLLTVGEMPGVTVEHARKFTDPARRELDMVFQFEHVDVDRAPDHRGIKPLHLPALKEIMARWQLGLFGVGWNSLYWGNHDQPRSVSRFGDDGRFRVQSAKLLAAVLHLQQGTPYVYQGDELGMTNYPFTSFEQFQDIGSRNAYREAVAEGADPEAALAVLARRSRDNGRTPFQWDAGPNAGFTTGTPWLAVNPNHAEINAAAALGDPDSVLHFYRELIRLRHTEPVVVDGEFVPLLPDHEQIYAYLRRDAATELLLLANWSSTPAAVPAGAIPDAAGWVAGERLLPNYPDAGEPGTLRPWELRVFRRPRAGS